MFSHVSKTHFLNIKHFLRLQADIFSPAIKKKPSTSCSANKSQPILPPPPPNLCVDVTLIICTVQTQTPSTKPASLPPLAALCICSLWSTPGLLKVNDHVEKHYKWPTTSDLWGLFSEFREEGHRMYPVLLLGYCNWL